MLSSIPTIAAPSSNLEPWREAKVQPVAGGAQRHVIHSYFNTCPESPDGKYVLFYTSESANGECGDLRILNRLSGEETVIASGVTTEDAHRAACQQWVNHGRTIVYHDCVDGRWMVKAIDLASRKTRILAADRQVGFGSPSQPWLPIYGCHWNPGEHRDLELVHVETGETKRIVTAQDVVREYPEWVQQTFGATNVSVFFPVLSPDGSHVFFKMSLPSGAANFRSSGASKREGKIVYDLENGRFVRLFPRWGHPSWHPDSKRIFEKGNVLFDVFTGKNERTAPSSITDHPSVSPDAQLFVTDGDVTKRPFGAPGEWAIVVGSMRGDEWVIVDQFLNTQGARSWRRNHPHPIFSHDGRRIYYNVNEGEWTRLMVAEIAN